MPTHDSTSLIFYNP